MKKGKFIVIDGTDGSGKATQTKLLCEALEKKKIKVKKIDFPQYTNNFFGKLLRECLDGKLGDFIAIDSKIASVLYAADRWESSETIKKWLEQGYIVIADRYASSNQIHQGGKIFDDKKRKEFLKWLDQLEFDVFKIPRPDAIIFLDVPIEITRKLLKDRAEEKNKTNSGKIYRDVAEESEKHLIESRESALKMVKSSNNWIRIDCTKNNEIMSIEAIHKKVLDVFAKIVKK
ncbi:MAG: dTMP kinase [bacterium]